MNHTTKLDFNWDVSEIQDLKKNEILECGSLKLIARYHYQVNCMLSFFCVTQTATKSQLL